MEINNTKTRNHLMVAAVATTLLIAGGNTNAQELAAPEKPGWETTAAAGLTLTSGTKDTLLATAGLTTGRKWERDELAFGISGGYGNDDNNETKTTTDNTKFIQGFGQYNRLFTDRFYAGARLDAAYDGIAELDYRFSLTPLVGYYLIKNTNTTLVVEAGPSAVLEKYSGESEDFYCGIRFSERLEHKLTETTKIWESVSYVPDVERWMDHYVITAEAGIDTAISKKWSLRVVIQDVYTSEVPAGIDNNELRLIAGTAYKF
jgi:putative salt-induced outer membrane protein YdiY